MYNNTIIIMLPRYLFVRLSRFTELVYQLHKFFLQLLAYIEVATIIYFMEKL